VVAARLVRKKAGRVHPRFARVVARFVHVIRRGRGYKDFRPRRYRFMASPVRKSFLHAMQYSPLASLNVMVDPALHQGQFTCFSCFTTRVLVTVLRGRRARRERRGPSGSSITLSMVTAGQHINIALYRRRHRVTW